MRLIPMYMIPTMSINVEGGSRYWVPIHDALKNASKNGKILICEPHFSGALDYDILQTMEGEPVQIRHVGFPREIFRNYGNYVDKMNYYGVNARQIRQELGRLLAD